MRYLKTLGLATMAAMAMTAFTAGSASATTLEVNGITQAKAVELAASLEAGTSALLQLTNGSFANTCTTSAVVGTTNVFTGTRVSGPISTLSFSKCTTEPVKVDKAGTFSIEWITGSTNGTIRSEGAEITIPSAPGTLNCKTGTGVDIGTLTGVASGNATLDIKAVLNCGFLAPSFVWEGAYTVTTDKLGVSP